jgi:hypothetical protein
MLLCPLSRDAREHRPLIDIGEFSKFRSHEPLCIICANRFSTGKNFNSSAICAGVLLYYLEKLGKLVMVSVQRRYQAALAKPDANARVATSAEADGVRHL